MAAKLSNDDLSKLSKDDFQSIRHSYSEWVSKNCQNNFSILVTGKTGAGKSRLVNALVGKRVAEEGRERKACTDTVTAYEVVIDGIRVVVWDSPGLQDGSCNERLYLDDMKSKLVGRFDVMIYCLSMTEKRFQEADQKAIRTMTTNFGKDLWKNAVVALNFANLISDPDEDDELAYFMNEKYTWDKVIEEFFQSDLGIDCKVNEDLPVVPTGTYKKLRLPTCENWLSELWMSCYMVMSVSSGLTFYRINKDRLTFPSSSAAPAPPVDSSPSCEDQNELLLPQCDTTQGTDGLGDIPREIPLNEEQEEKFWNRIWSAFVNGCRWIKLKWSKLSHAVLRSINCD